MNLKELIKEIEESNKIANKLGLPKYYIVVSNHNIRHLIKSSKDLEILENYYINEVAERLINDELVKEENNMYRVTITTRDNQYTFTEVYYVQIRTCEED